MSSVATARMAIAASQLRVEAISSYQAFLNLEPVWNQVAEAAGLNHPFLEFTWSRTWWECFGKGSELNILVLWEADEPIAIAPLIASRVRMWGIPVRRLGFLYNAHVPRADFIIAKHPEEAYRAFWNHLSRSRDWDLLQLCQLPATSPTLREISKLAEHDEYPAGTWTSGSSPYVPLDTSWSEYSGSLPAKHRSNLRNRFKRLNQVGPVDLKVVTTETGLEDALEEGLRLEASGWKGDEGTAIACASDLRQFYSLLAKNAAERGWLRLNFLCAGDKRVAFDYSLAYKNQIFLLKLGHDPEFSAYSPSNLLLSMALKNAFEQGCDKYDFLGEFVEWKRCWAKDGLSHQWLFIFSNGLKGRLLHFMKFGVVPRLKRLARKQ